MPLVKFIEPEGRELVIEAEKGTSLMEAAVENDVEGIIAECGGTCVCGTCHVYVDSQWLEKVGEPDVMETGLLSFVEGATSGSRLSCQIVLSDDLDGLIVHLPESQD